MSIDAFDGSAFDATSFQVASVGDMAASESPDTIRTDLIPDGGEPILWPHVGRGASITSEPGTFFGSFSSAARITDTEGHTLTALKSASFNIEAGKTYEVRILYKEGTANSQRMTLDLRNGTGVFWVYLTGPAGNMNVAFSGPHTLSPVENTSHGAGLYEARFTILIAEGDTTAHWMFGPADAIIGRYTSLIGLIATPVGESATASVYTPATLSVTEPADALAATVAPRHNVTFGVTEQADTASAALAARHDATLTSTEPADVMVFSLDPFRPMNLASIEAPDTAAGTLSARHNVALSTTEAADTVAGTLAARHNVALSTTEATDTATG
ncbi:MAG TPA: hypothetical protein VIG24_15755, partial [Acidimicrobiia bacterium]